MNNFENVILQHFAEIMLTMAIAFLSLVTYGLVMS